MSRTLIALMAAMSVVSTSLSQTLNPSARDILKTDRPLLPSEIAVVLVAAREATNGKTVRWSYVPDGPGPQVLFGPDGRPRLMRLITGEGSPQGGRVDITTVIEYTSRPARSCNGAPLDGDLAIEYEHRSSDNRWTATARTRSWTEVGGPMVAMLADPASTAQSGGFRQFGDRSARAVMVPWQLEPPPPNVQVSDSMPAGTMQSLWIDTESLLPLRWSLAGPNLPPGMGEYGLWFIYETAVDLRPPDDVVVPDCVPRQNPLRPFRAPNPNP